MRLFYLFLIGIIFALIDTLPMMKKKLEPHATASAFVYHLIMPFILYQFSTGLTNLATGAIVYFVCALPLAILAAKDDKKAVPIMLGSSCVIGALCGFILYLI